MRANNQEIRSHLLHRLSDTCKRRTEHKPNFAGDTVMRRHCHLHFTQELQRNVSLCLNDTPRLVVVYDV
jgi:hypothetical protein